MVNSINTHSNQAYTGAGQYLQNVNQAAADNIPLAGKINDEQTKALSSLGLMAGGAALGPIVGKGLNLMSGPEGPIVKVSEAISKRSTGFTKWFQGLKINERIAKMFEPVKNKFFNGTNVANFKAGYADGRGIKSAAEKILVEAGAKGDAGKALMATNTLESLKKINKMGTLGKAFGKTGLFLKQQLTGMTGIFNGLFAAMTINSVIQAKPGEKFSTLMEDVLGTWVGSLGGFSIFNSVLKGLDKVVNPATGQAVNGTLLKVAKIVNKIPGKTFVVPLIGAMGLSFLLQKVSHALFGKPTREEGKTDAKKDDMNGWLNQTGWKPEDFTAIQQAQRMTNPNAGQTLTPATLNMKNGQQSKNSVADQLNNNAAANNATASQYKGYMPKEAVPASVANAMSDKGKVLTDKVDAQLADMAQDLARYGIEI